MDLSVLQQYGPMLLRGFGITVLCWLLGTIFAMVLGLLIALVQRYAARPLRWLIQVYIEVIRGTPFLVQLFVLYYGGPLVGQQLMARAGFDPRQAVNLWQNMIATSQSRAPEFLSTHPDPASRLSELERRASGLMSEYQQAQAAGRRPRCG